MDKLPKDWKQVSLIDIIENSQVGLVRSAKAQAPERSFKYVKMNNIGVSGNLLFDSFTRVDANSDELEKYELFEGDFLFNTRNSVELVGKSCLFSSKEKHVVYNNNILRLRFSSNVNPKIINYLFLCDSIQSQLNEMKSGTTNVSAIYFKNLKNLKLPLPPLPEQKRIVSKLDALFERIDKSMALLEENIKHTNLLVASSLDGIFDKLSENHPIEPLLKHVDFIGGSQPPKTRFSADKKNGYVRLIQIRDYKSDNHIVYIDEKSTKKFCNADDVMIGRYGPPVFQILRGLEGAYNVALMKAIPDEKVVSKDFLFYFLQNGKIQNYIISISQRSAGQSGVNKKALELYDMVIPPLKVQEKTVQKIKSLQVNLSKLQTEQQDKLNNLKALKESILDKAFKGGI